MTKNSAKFDQARRITELEKQQEVLLERLAAARNWSRCWKAWAYVQRRHQAELVLSGADAMDELTDLVSGIEKAIASEGYVRINIGGEVDGLLLDGENSVLTLLRSLKSLQDTIGRTLGQYAETLNVKLHEEPIGTKKDGKRGRLRLVRD